MYVGRTGHHKTVAAPIYFGLYKVHGHHNTNANK